MTEGPAELVSPAPLADQVFTVLHTWIVNGVLPPNSRLRVRDLADRVGTSVMPVREAVRRLEEAGLVVRVPYKGAVVRELSVDELAGTYDVRILLEADAARRGAVAIDASSVDAMTEHWQRLRQAVLDGRVQDALRHDEELLLTLYAAGGNPVQVELIRGLWDRCRPFKILWASSADPGALDIWAYKPQLIEAAKAKDGRAASALMRRSLRDAKSAIRRMILKISESES
jgi:DNA-binding GntR family transcriptional regulator